MNEQEMVRVSIPSKNSLTHLGSLDSFDITTGGKKAGGIILKYLNDGRKDPASLNKAVEIYEKLIPTENFGGEYTSLQWLCRFWLAPEDAQKDLLSQPMLESFYDLLSADDFADLKMYLSLKYHYKEMEKGDVEAKKRLRFLEDFILFNNPDRERWEKTRANMEGFGILPGQHVADVGSGSGYFTFKFADLVGETGKVYAIETNPLHLDFLRNYIQKYNVTNVEAVTSSFQGIGLAPDVRVDVVYMCSLYHNVYAAFTDYERADFIGSIRRALRDGGRLIIVDNDLVPEKDIPYHGPYISKELIRAQLWYYGFRLAHSYQFTPQRYVLIFDKVDVPETLGRAALNEACNELTIGSTTSLVRYRIIGTSTSGFSIRGKRTGRRMYEAIESGDRDALQRAHDDFAALWPLERIGDDYTALMWFAEYILADEAERARMTSDKLSDAYFHFFGDNDFEKLRKYLYVKFDLANPEPEGADENVCYDYQGDFPLATLNEWNEYLIFNNPNRVLWERTREMLALMDIRKGEAIADIGCGGGYFSWQFAKLTGDGGKVYATEINEDAIAYLKNFVRDYDVGNIQTIVTRMNDAGLPRNSVDTIFMCSMYHAVYITDIEYVKDHFIATIKQALRPGGRLVIVDNDIPEPSVPSYYGPGIVPELVISQLKYYGFELEAKHQLIPQRYMLVFRMVDKRVEKVKLKSRVKYNLRTLGERFKAKPQRPQ